MSHSFNTRLLAVAVFLLALWIPLSNASFDTLGFADAAEFALVSDLAGIAHAPGFPAYVLLSKLFSLILQLSGFSHISSLVIFSTLCTAAAAVLLYETSRLLLHYGLGLPNDTKSAIIAATAALLPVTGSTIWHWSHSVEVYSLQVLAVTLVFHGLTIRETGKGHSGTSWCASGLAIGLANHHLTMIMFIPFFLLLWTRGWLMPLQLKKKKPAAAGDGRGFFGVEMRNLTLMTTGLLMVFYGWMYIRAGAALPFAFGSPDSMDRLFYHLSGGAWIKNTQAVVKGIVGMRLPYFTRLTIEQTLFSAGFMLASIIYLFKTGRNRLWLALTGYFLLIFIYQLRIDQTADTDAYLCTPFFLLGALVPFGLARSFQSIPKTLWAAPLLIAGQFIINYDRTDLRDFDLSRTLLRDIDKSAPRGSVILIADWTNVINYTYARIEGGFRKDLCVINYDLKFTHHEIFRRNYPEVYRAVAPQYDHFIELLGRYHPQEIYNTGCTLDQPDLLRAYGDVVTALQSYCRSRGVAFMADPKAYVYLSQQGLFSAFHPSGPFISLTPGTGNDEFLRMDYQWLNNRHSLNDPSASDKLVDLEAAYDMQRMYWQGKGDSTRMVMAENNFTEIKKRQAEMKKKMAFLFRRP